jgi:hypothetical protein
MNDIIFFIALISLQWTYILVVDKEFVLFIVINFLLTVSLMFDCVGRDMVE